MRAKIHQKPKHPDVDRVATLLVFLNRKIEMQIAHLRKEHEEGGLKLFSTVAKELSQAIGDSVGRGFNLEDSFSHFAPRDGKI